MIDFHGTTEDKLGRQVILAQAMNGTLLRLVINDKEPIPIPFNPSDDLLQPEKKQSSDANDTEPCRVHCSKFGLFPSPVRFGTRADGWLFS
jgi:hypothetical protein